MREIKIGLIVTAVLILGGLIVPQIIRGLVYLLGLGIKNPKETVILLSVGLASYSLGLYLGNKKNKK
jgi:hypothetical protein